jgi:hypothetical protein
MADRLHADAVPGPIGHLELNRLGRDRVATAAAEARDPRLQMRPLRFVARLARARAEVADDVADAAAAARGDAGRGARDLDLRRRNAVSVACGVSRPKCFSRFRPAFFQMTASPYAVRKMPIPMRVRFMGRRAP